MMNSGGNKMKFTEETIKELFGPEAAEDESSSRLKQYYFKGDVYEKIHNQLPLKILVGHKGIGKSAAFKVSFLENQEKNNVVVWIKPDDIMEICQEDVSFLQQIRDWKTGLSNIIMTKVLDNIGISEEMDNKDLSFNVSCKLISSLCEIFKKKIDSNIDNTLINKQIINQFLKKKNIYVYIDDLDRGWKGTESGVKRISALLNAARDLTNENEGLCIRISLRSDVYFLVRTSDESTDKIEGSVVWYTWTQHQILVMLAKRIQTYNHKRIDENALRKKPQFEIAKLYDGVFEDRFMGRGKWSNVPTYKVLASMIRRRPRDLIKIASLAARTAYFNKHEVITSDDLLDNFDYYSQERIQDTVNEYKSELPEIQRLIMGMKPSNRERKTSQEFIYTTEELLKKLRIIEEKKKFTFANQNIASVEELAAFLYKINFLVARKKVQSDSNVIDRRYFEDNKYLSNTFVDFGYQWEVHPAFRWALYPDGGDCIYESLSVDSEI